MMPVSHPGPSGSPSFLGPGGMPMGSQQVGGPGVPPPGLTPPMEAQNLDPSMSMHNTPPMMGNGPIMQNGPSMMSMYGAGGPLPTSGPHLSGHSPVSLSPHQMDGGRLSGPPQQLPMHHPMSQSGGATPIPPGVPAGAFPRRMVPMPPPADFKIYEMCRRLQSRNDVECDNLWWDVFVSEFFDDDATYTLNFCLEDGPKRYTFGRHLIPRYFRTMFDSGMSQLSYNLRSPKQDSNGISIFLECENTLMCTYQSKPCPTHIATEGRLQVEFTHSDFPSMRIKHWSFTIRQSHEYVLRQEIQALRNPANNINIDAALESLSKNVTRMGLTSNILNYLRLCVILEPMQELMTRHKIYGVPPRECLKNTLFDKWRRMVTPAPPEGVPQGPVSGGAGPPSTGGRSSTTKPRRKRKNSSAGATAAAAANSNSATNSNSAASSGGDSSAAAGGGTAGSQSGGGGKKKNSSSTPSATISANQVDVLVVGEPSLMGGEFGDEDERKITRLENSSTSPTGSTSSTSTTPAVTSAASAGGGGGRLNNPSAANNPSGAGRDLSATPPATAAATGAAPPSSSAGDNPSSSPSGGPLSNGDSKSFQQQLSRTDSTSNTPSRSQTPSDYRPASQQSMSDMGGRGSQDIKQESVEINSNMNDLSPKRSTPDHYSYEIKGSPSNNAKLLNTLANWGNMGDPSQMFQSNTPPRL